MIIANVPTASGIRASFANWFTVDGGFLPHGLMTRNADGTWTGLLMALVVVMFSFGGTELIGINRRRNRESAHHHSEGHGTALSGVFSCSTSARSA